MALPLLPLAIKTSGLLAASNAPAAAEYLTDFIGSVFEPNTQGGTLPSINVRGAHMRAAESATTGDIRFNYGVNEPTLALSALGGYLLPAWAKPGASFLNRATRAGVGAVGGAALGAAISGSYRDQSDVGGVSLNPFADINTANSPPLQPVTTRDVQGTQGGRAAQLVTGAQNKQGTDNDIVSQIYSTIAGIEQRVSDSIPETPEVVNTARLNTLRAKQRTIQKSRTDEMLEQIQSDYQRNLSANEIQARRARGRLVAQQARAGTLGTVSSAADALQSIDRSFEANEAEIFNNYVRRTKSIIYDEGDKVLAKQIAFEEEKLRGARTPSQRTKAVDEIREKEIKEVRAHAKMLFSTVSIKPDQIDLDAFNATIQGLSGYLTPQEILSAVDDGIFEGRSLQRKQIDAYLNSAGYRNQREELSILLRGSLPSDEVERRLDEYDAAVKSGGSAAGAKYITDNFGGLQRAEYVRRTARTSESAGSSNGLAGIISSLRANNAAR